MNRQETRPPEISAKGLLDAFAGSYADGEIRALAQEPVQNSKDARYGNEVVQVEYKLLRRLTDHGKPLFMLTVTDRGTTGLCGETNPARDALRNASEEELQELKWYHFERYFDSNKNSRSVGSRGWGKSIFLHSSRFPGHRRSAVMLYDTLIRNDEYRLGDFTILDDHMRIRNQPLLDDQARQAVSLQSYETRNGDVKVPLALKPLNEPGTRIVVPFVSQAAVEAIRNGSLAAWLQYLWWRPIADGDLEIAVIDEEKDLRQTILEPVWWKGDLWTSDATKPGPIHRLYEGCHVQILDNEELGSGCIVKRLAILYDAGLRDQPMSDDGPDYIGIQMFRAGQCTETFWDFELVPSREKPGIRAFVEFDENTDSKLRKIDMTAHDRFRRVGIVRNPILPYLRDRVHEFADAIGLIKKHDAGDGESNERFRRTSKFVFERLLSKPMGEVPLTVWRDRFQTTPTNLGISMSC